MSEEWVDERDKSILYTIYHCETCNIVMELGDPDVQHHKKGLPAHKMRRVLIVRCGRCGNLVTDSYALYSPEKNLFWCKNCIADNRSEFHGRE